MHIAAYLPETSYQWLLPTSFLHRMMWCWGWATWRRAWKQARWDGPQIMNELRNAPGGVRDFDVQGTFPLSEHLMANLEGRISTWAVFWAASIYLKNGLCLFPGKTLARNIGLDASGEHCNESGDFGVNVTDSVNLRRLAVMESPMGRFYLRAFFRYGNNSGMYRRLRIATGRLKHRLAIRLTGKTAARE
jgi:hypothetical protein